MTLPIASQSCGNCRFNRDGECRRFPPQIALKAIEVDLSDNLVPIYDNLPQTYFPDIESEQWCGEWSNSQPIRITPQTEKGQDEK